MEEEQQAGCTLPAHTWEQWPQPKGASGWGDTTHDAVKQEADLLTLGRRQEEHASPWEHGTPLRPHRAPSTREFLQAPTA